jgi:hypothetical protein
MVRILPNGDIVQDNDPRVNKPAATGSHSRRIVSLTDTQLINNKKKISLKKQKY